MRMDIEVTRNCKFKCGICSVRAFLGVPEKELTLEEVSSLITQFAELHGGELIITGGEPLERGLDFVCEMIKHAKRLGLVVKLYTVGYLITDSSIAIALKAAGLDIAYVSMEGTPEHDELYKGIPGSFAISLRAIELLQRAGVDVIFHFTPISINYMDIRFVVQVARELGIKKVKVIAFVAQGRGADNGEMYDLTIDERGRFGQLLASLARNSTGVAIEYGGSPDYPPMAKPQCSIGTRGFSVTNTGEVRPCLGLRDDLPNDTFLLGDIRENSLAEIWKSALMQSLEKVYILVGCARVFDLAASRLLATGFDVSPSARPIR